MPTPRKAGRFGGSAAHHKHIVANLATELIRHGRIRTTHAKAKTVQPTAERLITFAKRGDVHSRRQAGRIVRDGDVLHHLFAEVGPAFADREGGYTRVLKLGPRKGDAASMALVELVADVRGAEADAGADEPRRRWNLRRQRQEAPEEGEPEEAAASLEPDVAEGDEEAPEADPAEVEARLAAEEADAEPEAGAAAGDDDAERPDADTEASGDEVEPAGEAGSEDSGGDEDQDRG